MKRINNNKDHNTMANSGRFIELISTGYPSIKKGRSYRVSDARTAKFHAEMGWGKIADSNKPLVVKDLNEEKLAKAAKAKAAKAKAAKAAKAKADAKKAGEKTK